MEERMYSTQEVTDIAAGAMVYGGILSTVFTLGAAALTAGVCIAAEKIKEHVQKKKLSKAIDDSEEYVAERQ